MSDYEILSLAFPLSLRTRILDIEEKQRGKKEAANGPKFELKASG